MRSLLIARRLAGETADEAAMTAVDRLGFHLRLRSGDRIHGRRVAFLREVRNSDAAQGVLTEMIRQARSLEAVQVANIQDVSGGTPKVPPISGKTGIINVQAFCLQCEATQSRSAVNRRVVGSNPT